MFCAAVDTVWVKEPLPTVCNHHWAARSLVITPGQCSSVHMHINHLKGEAMWGCQLKTSSEVLYTDKITLLSLTVAYVSGTCTALSKFWTVSQIDWANMAEMSWSPFKLSSLPTCVALRYVGPCSCQLSLFCVLSLTMSPMAISIKSKVSFVVTVSLSVTINLGMCVDLAL
jgi:hypothetical protein